VKVTNTGTGTEPLVLNRITASANFAVSGLSCNAQPAGESSEILPGAQCFVSVTFTPTAVGTLTGTLSFTDNAPNSPQTINLTGTGVAQVLWSPGSLSFAAQAVATRSATKNVTLTNNLSTVLNIDSITFTGVNPGDFTQTNTCGSGVATNTKCTISVTFNPQATGTRTATLNISDSANNSPQTTNLTGTGK